VNLKVGYQITMMKVSAGVLFALSAEVNAQSQQLRSHKSSILKVSS